MAFKSGCSAKCLEDIQTIMDLTGWSKDAVIIVFFIFIFLLLVGLALLFAKFRKKRRLNKSQTRNP